MGLNFSVTVVGMGLNFSVTVVGMGLNLPCNCIRPWCSYVESYIPTLTIYSHIVAGNTRQGCSIGKQMEEYPFSTWDDHTSIFGGQSLIELLPSRWTRLPSHPVHVSPLSAAPDRVCQDHRHRAEGAGKPTEGPRDVHGRDRTADGQTTREGAACRGTPAERLAED